ncbi:MAG: chemotaxis protein CheW, partial [Gammaproteobacteria bacterium]|nr:chemotaxis protein CheW [Gammaproteobacteria bacterium]
RLGENLRDDEEEVDLIDLADLFAPQRSERSGRLMLVAQIGLNRMGFLVDKLLSQEEMVIKPLGDFLEDVVGFGGATVTSEGVFALIADLPGLARAAA